MSPLFRRGLWAENPAFVGLLGLCPLLAVSTSVANGLALALATTFVMVCSNLTVSLARHTIPNDVRLPAQVLVVATFTSAAVMIMEAWAQPLYLALALFIQIIVTNCAILARIEGFANREPPLRTLFDSLGRSLGFGWVLVLLGGIREVLSEGTLACGLDTLLGPAGAALCLDIPGSPRVIVVGTPAGAFLLLGLLLALRNWWITRRDDHIAVIRIPADLPIAGSPPTAQRKTDS